jgi:feruloyl-CoA synthase
VPRGYDALLPHLEADPGLRDRFFADLDLLFYGGASLPQSLWERLEALGRAATGRTPVLTTGYGATETAPLAVAAHFPVNRAGVIGVPVPGTEIVLRPESGKLSIGVRGPHVTPGYLNDPERTADAFDHEGFYRSGDAVRLADPNRPEAGVVFDGRLAEDFKLTSGTWVAAGALRVAAIAACAPVAQDAVVAGHDRDRVAVLVVPNLGECARLAGLPDGSDAAAVLAHPAVRETVRRGLAAHNAANPASSTAIARAALLAEPPDAEAGEITDKGYINQRLALERRADLVETLYAEPPGPAVIVV